MNIPCIVIGFCVATSVLLLTQATRHDVRTLSVSNGGEWGDWHSAQFCPTGSYAVGYDMKIESPGGDDTGLNAVSFICEDLNGGTFRGYVKSGEGNSGHWVGRTRCSRNHYLTAFALQVEPDQGRLTDDSAAVYAKFKCRQYDVDASEYVLAKSPGRGPWGSYGSWSSSCPMNSAICGIRTRIEKPNSDDTGMNDMEAFCCSEPVGVIIR